MEIEKIKNEKILQDVKNTIEKLQEEKEKYEKKLTQLQNRENI